MLRHHKYRRQRNINDNNQDLPPYKEETSKLILRYFHLVFIHCCQMNPHKDTIDKPKRRRQTQTRIEWVINGCNDLTACAAMHTRPRV